MLSLIIPCYCEAGHIEGNVHRVVQALTRLGPDFELIFVDDNSLDGTNAVIARTLSRLPHVRARHLRHDVNRGRGAALITGIEASTAEFIGYLDIDLEVSESYLSEALRLIREGGADMVVGTRSFSVMNAGPLHYLLSRVNRVLVSLLLGLPYRFDSGCGFKLFKRKPLLAALPECRSPGWFWDTEVTCCFHFSGARIATFDCAYIAAPGKKSTVRPFRDTLRVLRDLLAFRGRLRRLRPGLHPSESQPNAARRHEERR